VKLLEKNRSEFSLDNAFRKIREVENPTRHFPHNKLEFRGTHVKQNVLTKALY